MTHRSTQAADRRAAQAALPRLPYWNVDRYLLIDASDEDISHIISVVRECSQRGWEVRHEQAPQDLSRHLHRYAVHAHRLEARSPGAAIKAAERLYLDGAPDDPRFVDFGGDAFHDADAEEVRS